MERSRCAPFSVKRHTLRRTLSLHCSHCGHKKCAPHSANLKKKGSPAMGIDHDSRLKRFLPHGLRIPASKLWLRSSSSRSANPLLQAFLLYMPCPSSLKAIKGLAHFHRAVFFWGFETQAMWLHTNMRYVPKYTSCSALLVLFRPCRVLIICSALLELVCNEAQ